MKGKSVVSNGGKAVGILLRALLEETIAALFLSGNRGRDFAEEESTNSYDFAENESTGSNGRGGSDIDIWSG
ncbi:hypothetical protein BHE74_00012875 [Ensete ventricosum]|nr:hypothetical protein BHE74_00012875 [Ensete ventricosum]